MDFNLIKRRISIAAVLENKGYLSSLRKRGGDLVGPCPVHGGDNPNAFVVNLDKNLWYCFTGCQSGGDVIELVRRLDRLSYAETARYLARLDRNSADRSVNDWETDLSHPLKSKQTVQPLFKPYLKQLRVQPDTPFLVKKGILPTTASLFEAGAYHGRGMLAGCIAVRVHDCAGHALGYAGRRLDPLQIDAYGKWVFPKGLPKKRILYNYHRLSSRWVHPLVVVECPWGVMRLAQLGIPAVALLGVTLSRQQVEYLRNRSKIVLLLDGDTAGQRASKTITKQLKQYSINTSCVFLPSEIDPDDLDNKALQNLLKSHLLFI